MSIELTTMYAPAVDELFKAESKISLLTNTDFDWTGAHSIKVYKISTSGLNNYARNVYAGDDSEDSPASLSRFGKIYDLSAATEELLLSQDKSFIFNIDKLDQDETAGQLEAGTALARQLREVVIPTIDSYVYDAIVDGAGTTAEAAEITAENIYELILTGTETLDDNEVPETGRVLIVSPAVYKALKAANIFDNSDIGAEARMQGVVGVLDGMAIVRVPSVRLPEGVGFIMAHPSATVAPVKLEDYGTHPDTVISSGTIVTGRVCYDAFVLDNKTKGIYVQPVGTNSESGAGGGSEDTGADTGSGS